VECVAYGSSSLATKWSQWPETSKPPAAPPSAIALRLAGHQAALCPELKRAGAGIDDMSSFQPRWRTRSHAPPDNAIEAATATNLRHMISRASSIGRSCHSTSQVLAERRSALASGLKRAFDQPQRRALFRIFLLTLVCADHRACSGCTDLVRRPGCPDRSGSGRTQLKSRITTCWETSSVGHWQDCRLAKRSRQTLSSVVARIPDLVVACLDCLSLVRRNRRRSR